MKKIVLLFLVLTLIVAAVILVTHQTERTPRGAELLPDSTLAYVSVADFPAAQSALQTTPLFALWKEPEVQAFCSKLIDAMQKDGIGGELTGLLQGEVFVAVTRVTTTPKFELGFAAGVDVKGKHAEADRLLNKCLPGTKLEQQTYLGTTYRTGHPDTNVTLCLSHLGTMLVLTSDEEQMRSLIARYTGHAPAESVTLAASPRYQRVLQGLPTERHLNAFLNVEQLVSQFGMILMMAAQASPAVNEITKLQASAASMTLASDGVTDVGLVTYSKSHVPEPAVARHTLAAAPADSALYVCHTADLAKGYTKLMEMIARSGNPNATQIGAGLDKFLQDAGIRLAEDFLTHLGPEVAYIGNWRTGAQIPDFALVTEVKDPAALRPAYDKITAVIKKTVTSPDGRVTTDELAHAGETLHVIRTGSSHLSPTLALTDQYFVIALSSDYAREIVSLIKSGNGSLRDAADFKNATRRLPSAGTSFTYCDLRKVLGGIYTIAHANQPQTNALLPIAWDKLPTPETIAKHVGIYVSTTVQTDNSSTSTALSPLGKPASIAVGVVGGLAAAQPLLSQLPAGIIPGLPTTSSSTTSPRPRPGNRTAASQTPPTQ